MSNYGHIWRSAAHSGHFCRIESELITYVFRRQRVADTYLVTVNTNDPEYVVSTI